jgi:hypothetical protein
MAAVADETVYELREYHLNEGKQEMILARFRGKEREIFARYGMVGWGTGCRPTSRWRAGRSFIC